MSAPVLIFVHGIRSDSTIFGKLRRSIEEDEQFNGWELLPFDYEWGLGVRSAARRFRELLSSAVGRAGPYGIYIVAHSMGGLVARMALMDEAFPDVRRLVMVATPNFGAITTGQLGIFWQPVLDAAYAVLGIYRKIQAYHDLMYTYDLFHEYRVAEIIVDTEYATVPAGYFHDARKVFRRQTLTGSNTQFAGIAIAAEIVSTAFPMRVTISRPHDGIVEEKSVSLEPVRLGRLSEKRAAIESIYCSEKTYAHVVHDYAEEVDHSTIMCNDKFLVLIKDLLLADSLLEWNRSPQRPRNVTVRMGEQAFLP